MNTAFKLALLLALNGGWAYGQTTPESLTRTVSVSASVDTLVMPDVATFTVSEYRQDKQASVARDSVLFYIERALAICRRYGASGADIKTDGLKSKRGLNRRGAVIWYSFNQSVTFTFRNLDSLRKAVTELVTIGIEVDQVRWRISEEGQIKRKLAERAMDVARDQAQLLAARLGQHLGPAVKITDGSLETLSPSPWGARGYEGRAAGLAITTKGTAKVVSDVAVEPGRETLNFRIYVVFELKGP